ncbi:MAG: HIT family protein [Bryobacteraceae bacterium]
MDRLWSPWRYEYVTKSADSGGCIFCDKTASGLDRDNWILFRGVYNYVLLNLFPYTNGHMMVAPYEHVATLVDAPEETVVELMRLTRKAEGCLRAAYRPHGINVGMNLGECAGAGVAGHIHMHVLPRWVGDSNFMTTIGETRVLPEAMETTYDRLHAAFHS